MARVRIIRGKPSALVRRAVKRCAATADLARGHTPGIVILIYHRVGRRSQTETDLPIALFTKQMEDLAASGRIVTLDTALSVLDGPPRALDPVVITFDDGTADFAECAIPVLERFKLPATLYLATHFTEHAQRYPDGGVPLSWAAVREVVSTGLVTVGSHTHTHPRMDRLDYGAAAEELDRSVALIEGQLGFHPEHFAYPYSVIPRPDAERAVRERCRSAAVAGSRPNRYGRTDLHRLTRAPIQLSDGMVYFHKKVEGGMRIEEVLRAAINPAPRTEPTVHRPH